MTTLSQAGRTILAPLRQGLARGMAWWLAELGGMLPGRLQALSGHGAPDGFLLTIGNDRTMLVLREGRRAEPTIVPVDPNRPEEARDRIQLMVPASRSQRDAVIQFTDDTVLSLDVVLPLAAEASLDRVLGHQIERLTPLDASALFYAHRVVARQPADKTLTVTLQAIKRTALANAVALGRSLGLRPIVAIGPNSAHEGFPPLWRETAGTAGVGWRRWVRRGFDVLLCGALIGAYGVLIVRLERQRDALRAEVAGLRQEAAQVQALSQNIGERQKLLAAIAARQAAPQPVRVLDELTRIVPMNIWIFHFIATGGSVEIGGYAPRATDLLARIEASPLFANPRFRSAITLAPDGKSEQFNLTFELRAGAAP